MIYVQPSGCAIAILSCFRGVELKTILSLFKYYYPCCHHLPIDTVASLTILSQHTLQRSSPSFNSTPFQQLHLGITDINCFAWNILLNCLNGMQK
ncbi:hypothetical protein BX070DRAFT_229994 [Coemansia spiralis]|nr:hypothetical protein BX070DRAFT_229994 [Coemansia spiralis]